MRHRPFRFFFGLAIGFVLLSLVARVFVFALIAAAIMSTAFFIGRKVVNFFRRMNWREDYEYEQDYNRPYRFESRFEERIPAWELKREPTLQKWDRERIIEVR